MRPLMYRSRLGAWLASLLLLCACSPPAPPAARAPAPVAAQRIITLSPHLTELAFAAGAGDHLVGAVAFSDYPPAASRVPRVGDAFRVDYEVVAALDPDLILGWTSGNPPETLARLRELGFHVVALEPTELADIGRQISRIGALAGTLAVAEPAAAAFQARLDALGSRAAHAARISVFLQLAARPYYTVTDRHFLGQGLQLCAGDNVFGGLPGLTAIVEAEAVLDAAPEVIIASDISGSDALAGWQAWPGLPAVRDGNLFLVDADLLSRPGPRLLDGIELMCARLDEARGRRRPEG